MTTPFTVSLYVRNLIIFEYFIDSSDALNAGLPSPVCMQAGVLHLSDSQQGPSNANCIMMEMARIQNQAGDRYVHLSQAVSSKALHLMKFVNLHAPEIMQTYLASAGLRSSSLLS